MKPPSAPPPSWEGALLARLRAARERLERERAAAPELCAELLAPSPDNPPENLLDARAERIAADPHFRTWGVCEELLRRSTTLEETETDAGAAGHLASLALAAARGLDEQHEASLVRDLETRAWASLGTARLRSGDLAGAVEALREGARCLTEGTGDLLVEGRLLELEAAIREAQGALRDAAGLLRQAEARYREIGEATLAERAASARERLLSTLNPDPNPDLNPD